VRAEPLARRNGDPVLGEQSLGRHLGRELEPDEERPLAARLRGELASQRIDHAVAPLLVPCDSIRDAVLRPVERRDACLLDSPEHTRADVIREQFQPCDQLGVPDDEAQPPARHPVGLRHREHLDAHLLRTRLGKEARRAAAVEDQVAVREVVDDDGSRLLGETNGVTEDARRRRDRARIRRVVQVHRGAIPPVGALEIGRPAGRRVERQMREPGASQRHARGVVGIPGIREQDRRSTLSGDESEFHDRGLRSRNDRHLALGIELDAVDGPIAVGDCLLQLG
jgi:hypothetical protein